LIIGDHHLTGKEIKKPTESTRGRNLIRRIGLMGTFYTF